jgi:hypothetical protein
LRFKIHLSIEILYQAFARDSRLVNKIAMKKGTSMKACMKRVRAMKKATKQSAMKKTMKRVRAMKKAMKTMATHAPTIAAMERKHKAAMDKLVNDHKKEIGRIVEVRDSRMGYFIPVRYGFSLLENLKESEHRMETLIEAAKRTSAKLDDGAPASPPKKKPRLLGRFGF